MGVRAVCGSGIACFDLARAAKFLVEPSLLEGLDRDLGKYFYYTLSSVLHIPAVCSGQTRHDISDPLYHSLSRKIEQGSIFWCENEQLLVGEGVSLSGDSTRYWVPHVTVVSSRAHA